MTLVFDPGEDFAQVADGQETVTLTRPGSSTESVLHALRVPIRSRLIAEPGGHYATSDVAWHIRAAEFSAEPRSGDVIVDAAGRRWTVLDVEITLHGSCRRCLARNLAVFHGMDAYVDIEQSTIGKGLAGAETRDWQTWRTGLAARIQPVETRVHSEHDRRVTRRRFKNLFRRRHRAGPQPPRARPRRIVLRDRRRPPRRAARQLDGSRRSSHPLTSPCRGRPQWRPDNLALRGGPITSPSVAARWWQENGDSRFPHPPQRATPTGSNLQIRFCAPEEHAAVNLEKSIHQRWAADPDLSAALPAERVVTGRHAGRDVPYATVHRRRNRKLLRTNDGDLDEATLVIHVWHDDYDAGRAIAETVQRVLDGSSLSMPFGEQFIRLRRTADSAQQHDDGLWQFSLEFVVQVFIPHGYVL